MAVIESRAPEIFDKDNRPTFNVVQSFHRTQDQDMSSISAIALSPEGDLLAIGYASGIVEIRHTSTWRAIRIWKCGVRVVSFVWNSRFTRAYCFALANGVLRMGKLAFKEEEDIREMITFGNYIHTIALNEDSNFLVVAYGFSLLLLSDPLPEKDHTRGHIHIPYEYRPSSPPTVHDCPLSIEFLGREVVFVVYLGVAMAFEAQFPFDILWVMHPLSGTFFGRGVISPDGREFVCQNLTDGIQRYSLIKRHRKVNPGVKHDHLLSFGQPKNMFYGLDFLDQRTLVTGHNNGYIIIVRDTGRINTAQRYDTHHVKLHKSKEATAFVVTGYVQNKPVIIAVSGEGPRAKIYVIAVLYIRCDPDIGVKVLTVPNDALERLWFAIFLAYVGLGFAWYKVNTLLNTLQLAVRDLPMAKID